jgi:hypothetical protein
MMITTMTNLERKRSWLLSDNKLAFPLRMKIMKISDSTARPLAQVRVGSLQNMKQEYYSMLNSFIINWITALYNFPIAIRIYSWYSKSHTKALHQTPTHPPSVISIKTLSSHLHLLVSSLEVFQPKFCKQFTFAGPELCALYIPGYFMQLLNY